MISGTLPMVGAVLVRDGRLLLGLRSAAKDEAASCWDVIGGHVERGETFEAACIREIDEELGVRAELDAGVHRTLLSSGMEYRVFRLSRWSGNPCLSNNEHSRLDWFTPAEACCLRPLAAQKYVSLFAALATD